MRWLLTLFIIPLRAFVIGNPADPALMSTGFFSSGYPFFKLTSGYSYDYSSNKHFASSKQALKQFSLQTQSANFSLILIERLELLAMLGNSKEMVKEYSIYDAIFDIRTNYHFSYSLGAKAILIQWGKTYLSGELTYFDIPASEKSFFKYLRNFNIGLSFDEKKALSLEEWQASLGLATQILFLTPYGGGNYLSSTLFADTKYQNKDRWGYFYGVTLSLTGRLHINFERRMGNESAYTLSTIAVF